MMCTHTSAFFLSRTYVPQGVLFEGVVGKIAAAAGDEEDGDDNDGGDRGGGKTADSPPPPPIPTAAPPGMVCPRPLAWDHPEEVGAVRPWLKNRQIFRDRIIAK